FVDRRGTAVILGCAKHHDGGGAPCLILARLPDDGAVDSRGVNNHCQQQPHQPCFPQPFFRNSGGHQLRNSASSLSGMAPWRRMVILSGSLMSMMVEATSRGLVPPSTIRLMRAPSCSRTPSAVVHSLAPL